MGNENASNYFSQCTLFLTELKPRISAKKLQIKLMRVQISFKLTVLFLNLCRDLM